MEELWRSPGSGPALPLPRAIQQQLSVADQRLDDLPEGATSLHYLGICQAVEDTGPILPGAHQAAAAQHGEMLGYVGDCLLYTSDAADE